MKDASSHCRFCGSELPPGANYCPNCGRSAAPPEPLTPRFRLDILLLTLLGSILLTLVLSWAFHLPVFILAGFLPLFWVRRKR